MNPFEANNLYNQLKAEERRLQNSGEYLQAVDVVDQILTLKPIMGCTIIDWLWLRRRGLAHERAGQAEMAVEDYQEALRLAEEYKAAGRVWTSKFQQWQGVMERKVESP